ncbi:MAG: hypothetical protein JNK87_09540 [Bryobacterales bacterium]|nr:hypothetical protein [Bryobacterales bacterium]
MRAFLRLWVLVSLLPAQQTPQPTRTDLWKQDLTLLIQAIRQNHPAPTANLSSAELDEEVAALGEKIAQLPDYGIVMEMARITARIGDSNTILTPFQSVVGMRAFPLRVRRFGSDWYVTDAVARHIPLLGRRLTAIQGLPVDAVLDLIRPFLAYETDNWLSAMGANFLISPEVLAHIGLLTDRTAAAEYEFEDGNGVRQPVNLTVEAGTLFSLARNARGIVPLSWRNRGLFYWFDYLEPERTLYIKYDVCAQDPALPLREFVREITQFAVPHRVTKLVVDFRDNIGGGDVTVTELLFSLLQQAQTAGTLPQRSFGIISRNTFANGSLSAQLWKKAGAQLVGETTGGRPHHFGAVRLLGLPASRLVLQVATREIPADDGNLDPDMPVSLTLGDYRFLRDTVLEAILTL